MFLQSYERFRKTHNFLPFKVCISLIGENWGQIDNLKHKNRYKSVKNASNYPKFGISVETIELQSNIITKNSYLNYF